MEDSASRPFAGARMMSGDLNKYLELSKTPCKVNYKGSSSPGPAIHSRPMWKNNNNPFQYDRNYLARADIARSDMAQRQAKDRSPSLSALASPLSVTGWSQIWGHDSVSSPSMRRSSSSRGSFRVSYASRAPSSSNAVSRLSGGESAAKQGASSHIPGYMGFLPGFDTHKSDVTLGFTFGRATSNMDQFRAAGHGALTGSADQLVAGRPSPWVSRQGLDPAATA